MPPDSAAADKLADHVRELLRSSIEGWRPNTVTRQDPLRSALSTPWLTLPIDRWNRHVNQALNQSLPVFEEACVRGVHLRADEQPLLQDIVLGYDFQAVALPVLCSNPAELVAKVKMSGVWQRNHSEAEFGLAVHVHAYPNRVLACWVYIASIGPRQ